MKSAIYLGTAIALLRFAVAVLPTYEHGEYRGQNQLVLGDDDQANKSEGIGMLEKIVGTGSAKEVDSAGSSIIHNAAIPVETPLDADNVATFKDPSPPSSYLTQKYRFSVGSTTNQWAITYTPYNDDLTCKTKAAIDADVAMIAKKGFTSIRVYATDCSILKYVGSAAAYHKLKLILGIHIDDTILMLAQPQINEIITWANGNWDIVEMIVVGNEAIFNDFTTPNLLAEFITSARDHLREAGYSGPITTTEPIDILLHNKAILCPVIDVAAANIHPFFHADVSAEIAGDYVISELERLEEICPGMQAVNLETGWPKVGMANGVAVPGVLEQWVAVAGIQKTAGGRSVFLGFGDDGWKEEGEFGVETSWGCAHIFGVDQS
ncbi:hypothetical protein JMJ35_001616 [Cladonia borealis]|uniref:Probable beta-glucosidase btgE n=1 Tax=Cladonia borealis TaxID=184061 RepID=A0AA39R631_9LECA|nr:hypothetical protein JMJ35_001616 [Cladonia borealis]